MLGPTAFLTNAILDHLRGGATWVPPGSLHVQLHTAEPGATGTTAVAAEARRIAASFGSAASGGLVANTAEVAWTPPLAANETCTHFSLWDAASGGNCLWTGDVDPDVAVATTRTFSFPAGRLTLAFAAAADVPDPAAA